MRLRYRPRWAYALRRFAHRAQSCEAVELKASHRLAVGGVVTKRLISTCVAQDGDMCSVHAVQHWRSGSVAWSSEYSRHPYECRILFTFHH